MEIVNSTFKSKPSKDQNLLEFACTNFKNPEYILKLNTLQMLKFFKDELTIKYIGKAYNAVDYGTAQANKPINKNHPIFYFEVEVVDDGSKKEITIGFSDKEFVLNKQCGTTSKSYGYCGDGKVYHDKAKGDAFGPKFRVKDVIGCGYFFSKNSIFYTLNGKFLGWAFKNVDFHNYYPTISLHSLNEKVTANFGKQNFVFDIEGFYISQTKEKVSAISSETVEIKDLDYIVREYLVHSGYQESFIALNKESNVIRDMNDENDKLYDNLKFHKEISNLSWRKDSDLNFNERQMSQGMDVEDNLLDLDKLRKYSADEGILREPEIRKRTLSFMIDRMNDENEKDPDIFLIMNFLKERKIIQNMLVDRDYDTALLYFQTNFQSYSQKKEINFKKIILCLTTLKYIERLRNNDYISAYHILDKLDSSYWSKDISIVMYDNEDKLCDFTLDNLSVFLCYQNLHNSELKYIFSDKQVLVIGDQVNSLILEIAGVSSESILEKVIKQQTLVSHLYRTVKNCYGEKINIKI